jgi:NTE family protein
MATSATAPDPTLRATPAMNARRVALVIGAGSTKCAAALGLWRALKRHGIELDMVVGCSGGAMYAAVMALGYDLETCERLTRELWTRKVTARRDNRGLLGAFLPKLFGFDGSFGMVHDGPLLKALAGPFGGRTFEEATIPLRIVATDVANGERVVIEHGSVFDAVRASIAIPYVWRPWPVHGRMLLDGCMSDPLPVDVAMREGADVILAMGFESPYPRKVKSATRYAFQVNSIYTNNLLRANYAFHNLAHHAEIIPVLPEFDGPIGLFDTDKFPYIIDQGEKATEEQIPYLLRMLSGSAAS